jgi:hypothetical protein
MWVNRALQRLNHQAKSNKNNGKHTYTWKPNNTLLNDNLVKEEIKKKLMAF